jgi:hypothetical protein
MALVTGGKDSEAGKPPPTELFEAVRRFNEELVKARGMLAGEGLRPSSEGARVRFEGAKRTVIDGPLADANDLIAGFRLR